MFDRKNLMTVILEKLPLGVFVVDEFAVIEYANSEMCNVSGRRHEDIVGATIIEVESYRKSGMAARISALLNGEPFRLERYQHTSLAGDTSIRNAWGIPIVDGAKPRGLVFVEDITSAVEAQERERLLQAQLTQAQKMEAIGRLAGGVAHDFNNLLSVVLGNGELALSELPSDHDAAPLVSEIVDAGKRATSLTRQLLAFSSRQFLKLEVMELNATVSAVLNMLRRVLGEDISISFGLGGGDILVEADRGQIEQVVLNLAMNARDAMPVGGTLTIETRREHVRVEDLTVSPALPEGDYAVLSVADNGEGMAPEVLSQIFDPFFTTKAVDKGTGLGLATVYGIVTQHRGRVDVRSREGEGTTFEVFLPESRSAPAETGIESTTPALEGSETVVVVEDESAIRRMIATGLRSFGYRVLTAATGEEALAKVEAHEGTVDLLLTDVVMPGMNGRVLADRMAAIRPDSAVIFMSGYTDGIIAHHGVLEPGVAFIQKPATPASIATRMRELLATRATGAKKSPRPS